MLQRFDLGLIRESAQRKCRDFLSTSVSGIGMVAMLFLLPQDRLFAAGAVATKCKASLGSAAWAGDKTILFLDDDAILYRSGTRRVLQQPRRHADNPVIAETKAWEVAIGYCTVYRDTKTGLHQCWYQSYSGNRANDPTRRVVVCYATSNDGVVWEKPNLGLFDYNGDHHTNIVLVGNGGRSVNYGASVL
ncbi:MAG: hypothetical protein KAG66_22470, partial [Methylococcales bacterium]|nr:hypothetical protein [Methylococcales bacterium]